MNEQLYKKVGKRYVKISMPERFDMSDGIWIVQNKPHSKSMSSLYWKVGDLKRPADIVTHTGLQTLENELVQYLVKLADVNSKEYKEAKETCGGWLNQPIGFHNVSASQIVSLFIRKIATHLEEGEEVHWDRLQFKFRDSINFEELTKMSPIVALYKFTEWLKDNNIKFRQNNNIG